MNTNFILIQDDDSHWYVIPADREDEWIEYVEAVDTYWEEMPENQESPSCPDWAVAVGGSPSLVRFSDYKIE